MKTDAKIGMLLKRHWPRILYYGSVMIVLTAVAYAAEQYRKEDAEAILEPPAVQTVVQMEEDMENTIVLPENASVLRAYDKEPVWNEELGMWEMHMATDFYLQDGDVYAFSGGTIKSVSSSHVEIDSVDYTILYASIIPEQSLHSGLTVKAGEFIGTAAVNLPAETHFGPHLHVEMHRNVRSEDIIFSAGEGKPKTDSNS